MVKAGSVLLAFKVRKGELVLPRIKAGGISADRTRIRVKITPEFRVRGQPEVFLDPDLEVSSQEVRFVPNPVMTAAGDTLRRSPAAEYRILVAYPEDRTACAAPQTVCADRRKAVSDQIHRRAIPGLRWRCGNRSSLHALLKPADRHEGVMVAVCTLNLQPVGGAATAVLAAGAGPPIQAVRDTGANGTFL